MTATTKESLAALLQPIIGAPFTYFQRAFRPLNDEPRTPMTREIGCYVFEFGVQKQRNAEGDLEDIYPQTESGDWILAISCDWSLTWCGYKIVSSDEFVPRQRRETDAEFTLSQQLLRNPLFVKRVEASLDGGLRIEITDDVLLTVTPETTRFGKWAEDEKMRARIIAEGEFWQFYPTTGDKHDDSRLSIMTRRGLEEPAERKRRRFFDAIFDHDHDEVRALLEQGIRPQYAESGAYLTTLELAAAESTPEIVRLLLEHGVGVNETPSMIVIAQSQYIETLRLFLGRGGNVNERDRRGWTPLMEAAARGNLPVVRFLIEQGADIDSKTQQDYRIQVARRSPEWWEDGVDLETRVFDAVTALDVAINEDRADVAEYLRALGARSATRDGTPMKQD